ncbi:TetR family transcriptional regulator [Aureimonas sp. SA4125]|uniref:TetR/AcrR family transcriptional regulator n=1 Tax=Aureimonas sp. SA4125 TaxID=2826993 RepID=UPI001CC47992|nr:TetR/AcrR family transcriptional regulator [Aureimonas sp. SA4125]BDA82510.1 TetR family transcriptional regulator [Aureimonas sp. SA4125]
MGRNRSFDETEVLDRAVSLFWSHGYGATSVRDLERAMGMSSASFYNAFGDKRSLFKRSLQHYLDRSSRQRVALLDASPSPREAIEAFLDAIVEASSQSRDGCLLVNSAAEVAAHDVELGEDVAAGLREVEEALHRAVVRGQSDGSISDRLDAPAFAKAILGTIVSIRVMSRTASGTAYLRALADSQIAMLAPATPSGGRSGGSSGEG